MKKNRMMRLASVLLVLCLLTTSVISGTFAKYTSSVSDEDTARVAEWNIQFKAGDGSAAQMQYTNTLDVKLWDHTDANVDYDAKGDKVIAPGTTGSFNFSFENTSEVNAEYVLDYTVENDGVPIEYSLDNRTWTTGIADVGSITTPTALNMDEKVDVTIYWRWAFTGAQSANYKDGNNVQTDESDTTLGLAGSAAPAVTIDLTVTQVD